MSFSCEYIVQFRDTDAAGVVYFASILSICHVAYEASLIHSGIDLKIFVNNPEFAVPIFHVSADFWKPLYCGDRVLIHLTPKQLDDCRFEVSYDIKKIESEQLVSQTFIAEENILFATAISRHIVINPRTRRRIKISESIANWLTIWG